MKNRFVFTIFDTAFRFMPMMFTLLKAAACVAMLAMLTACASNVASSEQDCSNAPIPDMRQKNDDNSLHKMGSEFVNELWLRDFETLKSELEASYPNLLWKASFESDVDLPMLAARAKQSLRDANSKKEALRIIEDFIYDINDGHLYAAPPQRGGRSASPPPSMLKSVHGDAASACAALGYANFEPGAYSLPFERVGEFRLIADAPRSDFRTGVVTTSSGEKAAVARIGSFFSDNLVAACEVSFERVSAPIGAERWPRWCDEDCEARLREETIDAGLLHLRRDLARAWAMGARTLLIDVGGNDGGERWAWRLVQSLTGRPVAAPVVGVVADGRLDRLIANLSYGIWNERAGASNARAANDSSGNLDALIRLRAKAARAPRCNLSWVWEEKRAWNEASFRKCARVALLPPDISEKLMRGSFEATGKASRRLAPEEPLWEGSIAILVDRYSASAAELFAGYIQDERAGLVIGERTFGAGCGFVDFESPIVLPNTGLNVIAPDCVILRKNGANAVKGVTPDIEIEIDAQHGLVYAAQRILGAALSDAAPARNDWPR